MDSDEKHAPWAHSFQPHPFSTILQLFIAKQLSGSKGKYLQASEMNGSSRKSV
jgi:hypothetical protein